MVDHMRRILASPIRLRRVAMGLVLTAALLAAGALVLRDRAAAADRARVTHLLDAAAWLIAILGAAAEARVGAIFFEARPRATRRRALLLAVGGTLGLLGGCIVLSLDRNAVDAAVPRAVAAGALVAGLGGGLGGLLTLVWYYGGSYAADRIAEFDDDR